ncbi:MAG: FliM/FliN family flagellar motor switch protein, partial [Bacteroidetes bacterium]|nr:FliM/FliN family flagellar motor switch protein [Bacteroidota bacterium]
MRALRFSSPASAAGPGAASQRTTHPPTPPCRRAAGRRTCGSPQPRSLRAGDIIELDRRCDEDIDIRVEGELIFRGRVGQSHSKYAIRISERRQIERSLTDRTAGQALLRKGLISREQLAVVQLDERLNRKS